MNAAETTECHAGFLFSCVAVNFSPLLLSCFRSRARAKNGAKNLPYREAQKDGQTFHLWDCGGQGNGTFLSATLCVAQKFS